MSKVQSATVRLVMKKCKVNSIGEHPIYLSVCYNGRKEKSTGIFIEERYWNPLREEILKMVGVLIPTIFYIRIKKND